MISKSLVSCFFFFVKGRVKRVDFLFVDNSCNIALHLHCGGKNPTFGSKGIYLKANFLGLLKTVKFVFDGQLVHAVQHFFFKIFINAKGFKITCFALRSCPFFDFLWFNDNDCDTGILQGVSINQDLGNQRAHDEDVFQFLRSDILSL